MLNVFNFDVCLFRTRLSYVFCFALYWLWLCVCVWPPLPVYTQADSLYVLDVLIYTFFFFFWPAVGRLCRWARALKCLFFCEFSVAVSRSLARALSIQNWIRSSLQKLSLLLVLRLHNTHTTTRPARQAGNTETLSIYHHKCSAQRKKTKTCNPAKKIVKKEKINGIWWWWFAMWGHGGTTNIREIKNQLQVRAECNRRIGLGNILAFFFSVIFRFLNEKKFVKHRAQTRRKRT